MPRFSVELDPAAIAEARAAWQWYRERSPGAAARFLAEFDQAVEAISSNPGRWPRYIDDTRRYLLRRFPFYVVFRQRSGVVEIAAVAHGRRRPGYWRHR